MESRHYENIKTLLDLCWEIRRANLEGGDIAAGQYLGRSFEDILDKATHSFAYGCRKDSPLANP